MSPKPTPPARSLYEDPDYYGMLFDEREDDVRFYRGLAARAHPVLEYGIGAGRVGLALARAGVDVVGVEYAPSMVRALAARVEREPAAVRARIAWHTGDAREVALGRRFPLVICPFNSVAHHHTRAQLASFFARVREHLAPGGRFAFDLRVPDPTQLAGGVSEGPRFRHPSSGEVRRCRERFAYDPLTQVLTIETTLERPLAEAAAGQDEPPMQLALRQFFPQETLALLELHGFEVLWRTARFALPPADLDAPAEDDAPDDARGEMLAYVCRAVG